MTDNDTTAAPAGQPTTPGGNVQNRKCGGRGRKVLGLAVLVGAGILIGGAATKAFSHGFFHHGGMRGHHMSFMSGGPIDPARMDDRIERGIKHFAVEADATPEQVQKLTAIAKAAARDLLPMREKMQGARKQAVDLMTGASIDRAQIEKMRTDKLADMDAMSKRVSQAMADAAEILTPEQRKKLAERIAERRSHWRKG
jgi:periplasmic protein CpxP/Spy